jgi:hypothetical protein
MYCIEGPPYLFFEAPRRRKADASANKIRLRAFYCAKEQQVRFPCAAECDTGVDWSGLTRDGYIERSCEFYDFIENGFTCGENRSTFSGVVIEPFPAFIQCGTVIRCVSEEFANVTTAKSHVKGEAAVRKHIVDCVRKLLNVHGAFTGLEI